MNPRNHERRDSQVGGEDDFFGDQSNEGVAEAERRNREVDVLRRQHLTTGIREGVSIGREAHLQEGFDEGFSRGAKAVAHASFL